MTRKISIARFKNNITQGFELLVTDGGVPNVPIAQVATQEDAVLFAAADDMLTVLKKAFSVLQGECGARFRDLCPATWREMESVIAKAAA